MKPNVSLIQLVSTFTITFWLVSSVSANPVLRDRYDNEGDVTRRLNTGTGHPKPMPFQSWGEVIETLKYGLSFIVILMAAHPLGLFFPKLFKLPLITGYLVIGIIAGPFITDLITERMVAMMARYVSALALSFISFQAGQEIYLPDLRPQLKPILILLATLYVTAMTILAGVVLLAEENFFYRDLALYCQVGIALMFGSISVLGSPATVMAIKIELNSVGPLTSLMLGATMLAEFVVLLSFSVSRIICSIYCAELDVSLLNLAFTISVVLVNIIVGVLLAGVIVLIFMIPGGGHKHSNHDNENKHARSTYHPQRSSYMMQSVTRDISALPHDSYNLEDNQTTSRWTPDLALSLKGFIWLSMGYLFYIATTFTAEATAAAYSLSWEVKLEPLLILMIASCIAGHNTRIRHDMHVILDTVAPYMFLPFFVMTGAALKLDKVVHVIPLMSLYVGLRYVAIFIACYFGGRFLLKLTPKQYNNLWLTLTPQAGVALGLAAEVDNMSEESWATEFGSTIVAAVVVNQIVGPVLCSFGLGRSGETLKDRAEVPGVLRSDGHSNHKSIHSHRHHSTIHGGNVSNIHQGEYSNFSIFDSTQRMPSSVTNKELQPSESLFKIKTATVIGDDEVAFEVALDLSLYGAQVNVPLLDKESASKWQKMNETIMQRSTKEELISYKNTLKDRDTAQTMSTADVLIFTGDISRTRENVHLLKSLLGENHPRMIAFVPDCAFSKEMKELGVLVIQPSIALANIATRMALLGKGLALALSNELSTTSDFSTASYFMRPNYQDSMAEMSVEGRFVTLGRSVVNHHSVDYDRLAEIFAAERIPMPPPPSRVSMFGTSGAEFDPFSNRRYNRPNLYFMHNDHEQDRKMATGQYPHTPEVNPSPSPRRNDFNVLYTPQLIEDKTSEAEVDASEKV
ncbi:putative sodium/solute symporter superfamily [Plasmopara halstedii]